MYQHTAIFDQRQKRLWDCLGLFISGTDLTDVSLIGGGDLNSAFENQRHDYETTGHQKADVLLATFAQTGLVSFVSPEGPT
eukprot:203885-Rhodomonas_salina.1